MNKPRFSHIMPQQFVILVVICWLFSAISGVKERINVFITKIEKLSKKSILLIFCKPWLQM